MGKAMTTFEYIREKYGSRKIGGRFVWLNYRYYLQTLDFDLMEDGSYTFDAIKADENLNDPNTLKEVACGIIAAYIRNEHEKEPQQIFEDYYNDCYKAYKKNRSDIEFRLKPEEEKELVFVKAMINDEQIRIGRSKVLNDYLEENEQKGLALVGQHFMAFLHSRLQTFQTTPQPEASKATAEQPNQIKNFVKNEETETYKKTKTILSNWYSFLIREKVIKGINEDGFVNYMLNGDISKIYPNSKHAKFKSAIAKIKKLFADSWFDEVCKSAELNKEQMGRWNVGEGTAKSIWEKNLKQIAGE